MSDEQITEHRSEANAQRVEECCYRYLKIGGSLLLGGIVLMLFAMLFPVGVILATAGAVVIGASIIWYLRVRQQQGIMVACPSCTKEYQVLQGDHTFICDDCKHVVPVPRVA